MHKFVGITSHACHVNNHTLQSMISRAKLEHQTQESFKKTYLRGRDMTDQLVGQYSTHGKSHKRWHRPFLVARCHYCDHLEDVQRNLCDQSLGFRVHIWALSSYWRRSL